VISESEAPQVKLTGSKQQKELASEVLQLMLARGRFMSTDAPIRVSLDSIASFLQQRHPDVTEESLDEIVQRNPSVFSIDQVGETRLLVATRAGQAPRDRVVDATHSFVDRFLKPQPKPERPAQPVRERPRVDPSWASLDQMLGDLDLDLDVGADEAEELDEVAPEQVEVVAVEVQPEPDLAEPALARTITVASTPGTDVRGVDDIELASAIAERLRDDIRIANFGDQWMIEDRVPRFSRGDLRRLREYIQEQEQPLTDDMLVQDVLQVRPGTSDFDLMRFAINFRLSREHREFDFVGTANQRFWSTSNLPPIGTTRRKQNEIGTDYRYLIDESPGEPDHRSVKSTDHILTFYEYYLGLLPYDTEMQRLLPGPVLPSQRSAVLTFECPQSYTTYLVELRYPTPNRGGFILGLDDFFTENLVPGALISLSATENDGHYVLEYLAAGNQNARLLELDDRRQRYVFRPTSFACAVADEFLLSEERFPKLGSDKPLDERTRRRPESVVAATFERIGEENEGHGFSASLTDLLAAVNVERPMSEQLLRQVLEQDETGAFARDPERADVYTYVPGNPS
jgi:hypothetical protein